MDLTGTLRTTGRVAGALLVAGLLVGAGLPAHTAHAGQDLGRPELLSIRLDAPTLSVTFRDNASGEEQFQVYAVPRDRSMPESQGRAIGYIPGVPGEGRVATRSINGILPGIGYCVKIGAEAEPSRFEFDFSGYSNLVCADPPGPPSAPDLTVSKVEVVNQPSRSSHSYAVTIRNDGADAKGTAELLISTTGALTRTNTVLPEKGFTCTAVGPEGTATGSFRCTGGTLKQGESARIAFFARGTRAGLGYVHATVSVAGGGEADTTLNSDVLSVVVP
jgi:hypothetical protein